MKIRLLLLSFILSFNLSAQVGGDLDLSFGTDGIAEYTITVDGILRGVSIYDSHRLPDGKLLAVGWAQSGCSGTQNFFGVILRLNNDGSLDTTFQDGGYGFYGNSGFSQIVPASSNSLFVVGNERLRKIDLDGNIDTSFGVDGTVMTIMDFSSMALRSDGAIILGGRTSNSAGKFELTVSKRFSDGSLDTNFATDGYFKIPYEELGATSLFDLQLDNSDRILINGRKQRTQNNGNILLARLMPEGDLDTSFADSGLYVDLFHYDARTQQVYIENDGKILVAGNGRVTSFGTLGMVLSRLNSDGSVDTTYGIDGRMHHPIYSDSTPDRIHPFEGGYVISGDAFNTMFVVKINTDGSLNINFNSTGFVLLDTFDNFDETGFATDSTIEGNRMIIAANEYFAHCAQLKRRAHFVRVFLNDDGLVVTAFPAEDLEVCDIDNDGIELFDLTQNNTAILSGQTGVTISYYETQGDADTATNVIVNPSAYANSNNPQVIFARAEDDINGDFDTTSFNLVLNPVPSPFDQASLETCDDDNDGFAEFVLNDADVAIANGEPDVVITYHETQQNADSGLLPLSSPYLNPNPFLTIVWARVENSNTGCFTVVELQLIVHETPIVPADVSDILQCGSEIFDLTSRIDEILGTQSPSDFTLQFFESSNDAINNTNPIVDPTAYVNQSNPQTIYVRLEDNSTGCFNITEFDIIFGNSVIPVPPNDLFESDGTMDGFAIFNLTENTTVVLGGNPPTDFNVSYFETETDAQANVNPIANPEAYQNLTNPQTIYVRKTEIDTDCFAVANFEIETDEDLGINDNVFSDLVLFPNPAENMVRLVSSEFTSEVTVTICALDGKRILSSMQQPMNGQIELNISEASAGTYFVKIASEGNSIVKRLLKK